MMYETFLQENPKAKMWASVNQDGFIPRYGQQYFRWVPCVNQEDYLAYIEKIIKYAIEYVKTDLIHFDNFILWPEPYSCHCPVCREKFRQYLKDKYPTPEARKERFGFINLDFIEPPVFDLFNPPWALDVIRDPVLQEWIDFRVKSLSNAYMRFSNYVRNLNPNVAVAVNLNPPPGGNSAFLRGGWPPLLYPHGDVHWTEEPDHPRIGEDGRLISRIRTFKIAQATGNAVFCYVRGENSDSSKLMMAESMAYNSYVLGMIGGVPPIVDQYMEQYISFYKKNKEYFVNTESAAEVAVLRSYASLSYNNYSTHLSVILFEQTLIQARMPFDVIFDDHLKDLSKYKVLVLANVESLSNEQLDLIRDYVKAGGGLVATDETSAYDQWRRRRPSYGLADIFGIDPAKAPCEKTVRSVYGKGRVVYIPKIIPSVEPRDDVDGRWRMRYRIIDNRYWHLPKNWKELVDAVEWTGQDLSLKVEAPLTVTAEFRRQEQPSRLLIHLINYNLKNQVDYINVTLREPKGKRVETIAILSPDDDAEKEEKIPFIAQKGEVKFRIPKLKIYAISVIELR